MVKCLSTMGQALGSVLSVNAREQAAVSARGLEGRSLFSLVAVVDISAFGLQHHFPSLFFPPLAGS